MKQIINQWFSFISVLSIFFIPFINVARFFLLIWFISALFYFFANKEFNVKRISFIWILWPFFLILHLISLIYTENLSSGWFDIEVKLSFLVMPLIFMAWNSSATKPIDFQKLKFYYIIVGFIISFLLLIRALYLYVIDSSVSHWYYNDLSYFYHPSYLAMYVTLAIIFVNERLLFHKQKAWMWIMLIYFLIFLYFLSSKAGIIATAIVLIVSCIYTFVRLKEAAKSIILLLLTVLFVYEGIFGNFRFQAIDTSIKVATTDVKTYESNAVRILVWKTGVDLIKQHVCMGVGCGDIKDVLLSEYKQRGMEGAYEKKLNLHNQYMETWLSIGLLGVLWLLFLIAFPLWLAIRKQQFAWLLFLIVVAVNFLTESMLNTQAGVIFITYFYYFFLLNDIRQDYDTVFAPKN